MAAVDRAILRIGAFEILFTDDVDDAVAIDEAILLARELSTDDSPRFVNGVLAALASGERVAVAAPARERVDLPPDVELAPDETQPAPDERRAGHPGMSEGHLRGGALRRGRAGQSSRATRASGGRTPHSTSCSDRSPGVMS